MVRLLAWVGVISSQTDVNVERITMLTSPIKLNLTTGAKENYDMLRLFEDKSISG